MGTAASGPTPLRTWSANVAALNQAGFETRIARYAWVPSLGLDFFYGFNANQLTFHRQAEDGSHLNIGYVAQATLNIPIWNWGQTRSKIKQAEIKQQQARLDLSLRRPAGRPQAS